MSAKFLTEEQFCAQWGVKTIADLPKLTQEEIKKRNAAADNLIHSEIHRLTGKPSRTNTLEKEYLYAVNACCENFGFKTLDEFFANEHRIVGGALLDASHPRTGATNGRAGLSASGARQKVDAAASQPSLTARVLAINGVRSLEELRQLKSNQKLKLN